MLSVDRWAPQPVVEPEAPAIDDAGPARPVRRTADGARAARVPPAGIAAAAAPPLHRVRRLSYSALALFERCSYRYYVERIAGLREERGTVPGSHGLKATEIGDAVHRLLELVDLRAPVSPGVEPVRMWYPGVTDEELNRIGAFVASYCESELAARIATLEGAEPERPFAFEHDGVLLHGRLDVLWRDGAAGTRARLQDQHPGGRNARGDRRGRLPAPTARLRARVLPGRRRRGRGRLPLPRAAGCSRRRRTFDRIELPALEEELSAAIRRIDAGEFVATPSDFTCSGCPALELVCAGPNLRQSPGGWSQPHDAARLAGRCTMARSYIAEARRKKVAPKKERIRPIIERLAVEHADARIALTFSSPLELLVSVMLSAQTTDVNVNRVTEKLFAKYKRPEDYLAVPVAELERDIFATGFYRQKTKSLRGTMQRLLEEHDGEVPEDFDALLKLPGVARKTANVVSAERGARRGSSSTRTSAACRRGSP